VNYPTAKDDRDFSYLGIKQGKKQKSFFKLYTFREGIGLENTPLQPVYAGDLIICF